MFSGYFLIYKDELKIKIPGMCGSTGCGEVKDPLGPLKVKIEVVLKVGFFVQFEPRF